MYTQVEKSLIWLTMFNLSLNKANKVFNILSELDYKINDISAKKNEITNIVGSDIYSEMTETNEAVLNSYINNLNNKNIKCVTISSSYYPSKLKEIEKTACSFL